MSRARTPLLQRPRLRVEELEPRILYSADANPLLWAGADPNASAIVAPVDSQDSVQVVDASQQQQQRRREIVFVDAAVPDAQTLIDGILAQQQPWRDRAEQYLTNPKQVHWIVEMGTERARTVARQTMKDVREAMGLNY